MDQGSEAPAVKDDCRSQEEPSHEITETPVEKSIPEASTEACDNGEQEKVSLDVSNLDVTDKNTDSDSTSEIVASCESPPKDSQPEATESCSILKKKEDAGDTTCKVGGVEIDNLTSSAKKSETSIDTETLVSVEANETAETTEATMDEAAEQTTAEKSTKDEGETQALAEEAQESKDALPETQTRSVAEEAQESNVSLPEKETQPIAEEAQQTQDASPETETQPVAKEAQQSKDALLEKEARPAAEEAQQSKDSLPETEIPSTAEKPEESKDELPEMKIEPTAKEPQESKDALPETATEPTPEEPQESKDELPKTETSVNLIESAIVIESKKSIENVETETTSVEADSQQKESVDKQTLEPENTEFVQITQDKNDDTQNEGQSMEAEDPFGADDLISDGVEPPEVDTSAVEVDFRNLGEQADNLQDVVNAKDCNFPESSEFPTEECNQDDNLETSQMEIAEVNAVTTATNAAAEKSELATTEIESNEKIVDKTVCESMSVDSPEETNDETKKKTDGEIATMETDETESDVLPGQDDELCIIPDSMKESSSLVASEKTVDIIAESEKKKSTSRMDAESIVVKETTVVAENVPEPVATDDTASTEKEIRKNDDKSKEKNSKTSTDVISIEDECKSTEIEKISSKSVCKHCKERKNCNVNVKNGNESFNVCSQTCKNAFNEKNKKSMDIPNDGVNSKREKRCASCLLIVEAGDERNLSWETMEFCNEECLGKFQTKYGSYCRNCNGSVQPISLGKYCVRFGYDVRQFCCSACLEEFKKGLKVCSYCQKDISSGIEGFLAPVGDKAQFKDFCTQYCMEKYSRMNSTEPISAEKKACSVCTEEKMVHCEVQIDRGTPVAICSDPCFAAFKFVNKVDPQQCSTCKKFFEHSAKKSKSIVVFYESEPRTFCNKTCLNIFIITNRNIVPCNWCKVKKYNFDMIKKELKSGQRLMMCSLNCLTLYQVSINAVSAKRISCDFCKEYSQAQYHLTMSDATIRNFCSYNCVMKFQGQYTKSPITIPSGDDPVPTGMPKRTYPPAKGFNAVAPKPVEIQSKKTMPVISSVTSLALTSNGQVSGPVTQTTTTTMNNANVVTSSATTQSQSPQVIVNQQVIMRPMSPPKIHNKITQCKPLMHTKGVSVRPHPCAKSTQTEGDGRVFVPVPVPIYVPFPVHMWSMPYPVPVPFPLPIPVPIFIPTTRNSAKGIFKDIKRIQEKIPADPFEAELLMMAEMVATEKKANESESDSSDDNGPEPASEAVDSSNAFGEDMLQMALKMATGELDEPAVDLETALTPTTITATHPPSRQTSAGDGDAQPERLMPATRGKKRMVPYKPRSTPSKRGRRVSGVHEGPIMPPPGTHPPSQTRMIEPLEKPDANMALKYTFGVNAWRQWVVGKNNELEKQITPTRKVKLFKTDLLQLTADELNYTLCLFVKEVRKPNGAEYAPDTIYYLCLGIQQYLFENNRIDNIFTDSYYEKFTDCLNEVAKKFSVLYNEAQYIVTRVEEEHLWECKQLGAHSPHVLLSTLMFFNTKHFNLVTVDEHMQLSFSHIMKHWKRNPAAQAAAVAGKGPGTRNVLLRFYPPQSALEANSRKKKVYEQQENEDNPLRCPVKLYEFYLSKCPESVKTRNDVFYLLPERSCVPDSPVWYSTSALAKDHLVKMLYRVKMVKEINVALLTS